jgi:hypothetical protein
MQYSHPLQFHDGIDDDIFTVPFENELAPFADNHTFTRGHAMRKQCLVLIVLAALGVALTPATLDAYGAAHFGYTHVGPAGAYHVGGTAFGGYGGVYGGVHSTAVGYGGAYHYGYGGYGYGGAYHYGGTYAYAPRYYGGYRYIR